MFGLVQTVVKYDLLMLTDHYEIHLFINSKSGIYIDLRLVQYEQRMFTF